MDRSNYIANKLKRDIKEMKDLFDKQERLFKEITKGFDEKDKYVLPLKKTVCNLIEHGISKPEILVITSISSEQYDEIISENRYFQLPDAILNEDEANEFNRLLEEIQNCKDINQLIDPSKEGERISFIHRVLGRYLNEFNNLKHSPLPDDHIESMVRYVEIKSIDHEAKRAYRCLARIFGNEMKRKREEVMIKLSDTGED